MGTTYSKSFVDRVIESNGVVQGRPLCVKVVRYENRAGKERFGVVYEGEQVDRYEVPHKSRQNAKVIWENPDLKDQEAATEFEPVLQEA